MVKIISDTLRKQEKFINNLKFNNISLLAIAIILVLFPILALAHGGEDHEDHEGIIPIAQLGKLNSKLAKTSHTEILLKYPTPIIGSETQLRVFLTDINSNSPIENANINLTFSLLNNSTSQQTKGSFGTVYANADQFELNAVSSNIAGIYQVPVTFAKAGNYQIKLKITGTNIDVSAAISGVIVNEQVNQIASNNGNMFWILIITLGVLLVVTLGLFWYRRTSLVKVRV